MAARKEVLGILFMVLAGLAMTADMVFGLAMQQIQWPYWRIYSLGCAFSSAVVMALLVVFRTPPPPAGQMKWVSLLGFFSAVFWGLAVVAVQVGVDPGDVAALTSINIVFAAIMGRVFLDEGFRLLHMVAVTLSVAGSLLVAQPAFIFASTNPSRAPWYGYLCAVASGFLQGCFFICGRKAGDASPGHLSLSSQLFTIPLCALIPFTPLVDDASFHVALELPWQGLGWTGVAFLTTSCSGFFSCTGSMLCPAAISATVYTAASMFFGYLVQTIFFDSTPEFITVIGACLMLAAVSLMAFASRSKDLTFGVAEECRSDREQTSEGASSFAMDDDNDDAESLVSFIASEFSDFATSVQSVRFRGHLSKNDPLPPEQLGLPGMVNLGL